VINRVDRRAHRLRENARAAEAEVGTEAVRWKLMDARGSRLTRAFKYLLLMPLAWNIKRVINERAIRSSSFAGRAFFQLGTLAGTFMESKVPRTSSAETEDDDERGV
jgi:hypothetical protein